MPVHCLIRHYLNESNSSGTILEALLSGPMAGVNTLRCVEIRMNSVTLRSLKLPNVEGSVL
jgi:hypothetical protein